ncbi:hypothetical protein OAK17_07065 [Alphaproteobacteria bacterium]|nr:hypothetical protein [Alphaproteobacteria bacterium]
MYRCIFSAITEIFVSRFTTLGDNPTYVSGARFNPNFFSIDNLINAPRRFSTEITSGIGYYFSKFIQNPIFINLIFQSIAFVGIYFFLKELPTKIRAWTIALLMMPSFTIWSSIAGKEAIVIFGVGTLLAYAIRINNKFKFPGIKEILAMSIITVFKLQYLPAFILMFGIITIVKRIKQKTFFVLFIGIISFSTLYFGQDQFEDLSKRISINFVSNYSGTFINEGFDGLAGGRSTRLDFWPEPYDIFWKSPEGMVISFVGPTVKEALTGNIIHIYGFIEGSILLIILLSFLMYRSTNTPLILLFSTIFILFWILFATYPLGVMNPGTAIRYRTGHLPIIIMVIIFFLSSHSYRNWYRKDY